MLICDRLTDIQNNRQMPDHHLHTGDTFYLSEKITSPTYYANFALLICSVCRGIISSNELFRHKFGRSKEIFW